MAVKVTRCKYCGAKLASDGFCSKPCKYGKLQKQIAELQKKIKDKQSEASIWPEKP